MALILGKPQKSFFLVARPPGGWGGGKGLATKKKELFLKLEKNNPKFLVATKLEGGKALVATKKTFLRLPLRDRGKHS